MQRKSLLNKLKRLVKLAYLKLLRIKDSPIKIALGFGLGVFIGVMPGVGPPIAFLLAIIFRVNRLSAFLGSVLSNTWISFITLILAIKIGAALRGLDYIKVHADMMGIIKDFRWVKLFDVSVFDVLVPIGIGFFIVSLSLAAVATVVVYIIILRLRNK